jgi:hypothetical protein
LNRSIQSWGPNGLRRVIRFAALLYLTGLIVDQAAELNTGQVKARYIHNFVKYLTWPATNLTGQTFTIGVLKGDAVKSALEEVVRGKSSLGRPFVVASFEALSDSPNLQVLYINEANRERLSEILDKAPRTTLTIGEGPGFLARGGMLEFNLTEGKVRFSVNLGVLREAGFTVDSKLLAVAEEVRGK